MKQFRVFTPGPAYTTVAPDLETAMHAVETAVPLKRGWTRSWATSPKWPNRYVLQIFNSKGTLQRDMGACLVEVVS